MDTAAPAKKPAADTLGRAFIDILRREAGQGGRSLVRASDPDDPVDGMLDLLTEEDPDEPEIALAPDLVGATVMLARAVEGEDGLLRALRRGAPVAAFEVPGADYVALVGVALRACAIGTSTRVHDGDGWSAERQGLGRREVVLFDRDGTEAASALAKGNRAVADALRLRLPLLGLAPDPARHLPRDLLRACEHRVALQPLDAEGVALVIEAVAGAAPASSLDGSLVKALDLSDLALAVRHDRGADGSLARLEELLRAKLASSRDGPALEALEGYGAAKEWGLNLAADLRAYRAGTLGWAEIDKGILLSGAPGVGKTQFAAALARTCGIPFLAGSLGQWQSSREGHLGHCLAAMRAFFDDARRRAPCVALVDEIDSFGDRSTFSHNHKDYSVQVVNAFLECLDGAAGREGVVVVGATNDAERIDPAIRRPGRLDTHVEIPRPDVEALRAILRHHLGPDALAGLDLGPAAVAARGSTGADCEAWARRAKSRARRAGRAPGLEDLMDEIRAGRPALTAEARRRVAVHEAGHGVAAVALGIASGVTLGIHGGGGAARLLDGGLDGLSTEADIDRFLAFLLAGRAAEEAVLGEVSSGSGGSAASDLALATELALSAEARLGFGRDLPFAFLDVGGREPELGRWPWLAKPVSDRLSRAYAEASSLLGRRRADLERVAAALEGRGYLDAAEVGALVVPADAAVPA